MGMYSDKKRSSHGVVVWCVVLGIALLVVDAAGKEGGGHAGHLAEEHGDAAHCLAFCKGRSKSDFGPCYNECLYGRVTAQEEARGGGGVGGRAGLLATPTERAGREEEEKRKQTDADVRLTDPVWCYDACHDQDIMPYDQCVKEYCYDLPDAARLAAHGGLGGGEEARGVGADALTAAAVGRVTAQEEARGGGGVGGRAGLLATPTERAGREEEENRKQADAVLRLTDPVWCYAACHDQHIMPYHQCVKEYCYDLPDAARLAAHGGLGGGEARGEEQGGKRRVQEEEDDEETTTGALNVLAAAPRHEVAVGPCSCSGTGKVEACDYCCQREAFRDWNFDWDACIRCCDDEHSHPIKKEQEKNKDGVVPPAK